MRSLGGVIGGLFLVAALLVVLIGRPLLPERRCEEELLGLSLGPEARFQLNSTGSAIVIPSGAIGAPQDYDLGATGCGAEYSRRELTVIDALGNEKSLFAGVSRPADLARYLGTARHDRARLLFTNGLLNGAARTVAEGRRRKPLPRPSTVHFWQAQAHITRQGESELTYGYPASERFALMIANADGSPGIEASVWFSVELVKPSQVGWTTGAIAAAFALIGVAVCSIALRGWSTGKGGR